MSLYKEDIENSLRVLESGGVLLYPTDTVWGLGCDATNEQAIDRIHQIKRQSTDKPLIILLPDKSSMARYVRSVPDKAYEMIDAAEKPLTIILERAYGLPGNLTGGKHTVAIRIIREPFCQALLQSFGKPIVSTSANITGQPTPENFSMVDPRIIEQVDHTVTYRQDDQTVSPSSTIVKVNGKGEIQYIRK